MNTLFGFLLGVCTFIYCIRFFSWIWVVTSKKRLKSYREYTKYTISTICFSGMEHLLYMVTLIGSAILLL